MDTSEPVQLDAENAVFTLDSFAENLAFHLLPPTSKFYARRCVVYQRLGQQGVLHSSWLRANSVTVPARSWGNFEVVLG